MAEIPQAMVEAAAEALSLRLNGYWNFNGADAREPFREHARAALAAALAVCEVSEQWGYRSRWGENTIAVSWCHDEASARRAVAEEPDEWPHRTLIRRLVIVTPPTPEDSP